MGAGSERIIFLIWSHLYPFYDNDFYGIEYDNDYYSKDIAKKWKQPPWVNLSCAQRPSNRQQTGKCRPGKGTAAEILGYSPTPALLPRLHGTCITFALLVWTCLHGTHCMPLAQKPGRPAGLITVLIFPGCLASWISLCPVCSFCAFTRKGSSSWMAEKYVVKTTSSVKI